MNRDFGHAAVESNSNELLFVVNVATHFSLIETTTAKAILCCGILCYALVCNISFYVFCQLLSDRFAPSITKFITLPNNYTIGISCECGC